MRLKDKICIVTGAAQGIAAATVAKFAAEGAVVVACDRRARDVPGAAWSLALDVTDRDQVFATFASVRERYGRIEAGGMTV